MIFLPPESLHLLTSKEDVCQIDCIMYNFFKKLMLLVAWKSNAQCSSSSHYLLFTCVIDKVRCCSLLSVSQSDNFCLEFTQPKRPNLGNQGRLITLRSNFYEVRLFPAEVIHYNVTISDSRTYDKFPRDLNLWIIEELVRCNGNIFKQKPVYDANKSLYSMYELPFKSKVSVSNTLKPFQ